MTDLLISCAAIFAYLFIFFDFFPGSFSLKSFQDPVYRIIRIQDLSVYRISCVQYVNYNRACTKSCSISVNLWWSWSWSWSWSWWCYVIVNGVCCIYLHKVVKERLLFLEFHLRSWFSFVCFLEESPSPPRRDSLLGVQSPPACWRGKAPPKCSRDLIYDSTRCTLAFFGVKTLLCSSLNASPKLRLLCEIRNERENSLPLFNQFLFAIYTIFNWSIYSFSLLFF